MARCTFAADTQPAAYVPFDGQKAEWHEGFARYDFAMSADGASVTPIAQPAGEKFGIGSPTDGGRRCVVIVPKQPAPGNPWSWRGCYWDHQPQTEIELLRRGFHIAYISADHVLRPDAHWEAWYQFLTEKHGLSRKPVFIGMSRGGEYAFTWGTTHPDRISAIYADNSAANAEIFARLGGMADNDVAILLVCGTIDPILQRYSMTIENLYQQFGGRVSVMLKEGAAHHPHSLRDPKPLADFLERSVVEKPESVPDFIAGNKFVRHVYYGAQNHFEKFVQDSYFITTRGPAFVPSYSSYDVALGFPAPVTIIAPNAEAPGRPWVYRAGYVARDAVVDQALLSKGFHLVVGPVGFNIDGPVPADWDKLYDALIAHGFAKKPVMEGQGGAAAAAYAWAISHPDRVACIYAENPVLQVGPADAGPLDHLEPLAKAGVPILHACGSLDPALDEQTRVMERRYKAMGGNMKVIVKEGDDHFLTSLRDVKPVIDFIDSRRAGVGEQTR